MSFTNVQNTPGIVLQPTGPGSGTSLNPVYSQCDPTNGNYFQTTNRDLVTFYLYPATTAPTWLATSNYTLGSVVNFAGEFDTITAVAITTNVLTVTAVNTFTQGAEVKLAGLTYATFLNGQTVIVTSSTGSNFTATFSHANFPNTATITQVAVATNVLTVTAVNAFIPGQSVTLSGLTTATFLNGQTVTVATASGSQFTASFTNADYGPAADTGVATASSADTGTATNSAGVFIAVASSGPQSVGGAKQPNTPAYWSTYVDSEANVTLYSAPDACTGRLANVDDYTVPLGAGSVEFLVLPSSVFTQASGQFQFLASSNLIYVYVRNF